MTSRETIDTINARDELRSSDFLLHDMFNCINDCISVIDPKNFKIIAVNKCFLDTLNRREEEVIGKYCYQITHGRNEPCKPPEHSCPISNLLEDAEQSVVEHKHYDNMGEPVYTEISVFPITDAKGEISRVLHIARDITKRKKMEESRSLMIGILEILNRSGEMVDMVRDILSMVKKFTGFDAVGLRLRQGEDYPYYAVQGFPEEFIETDNYLCARDEQGKMIRDPEGTPYLKCMCGNVISGRTDSSRSFFTEGGSFWTNSTTKLLASASREDWKVRINNMCNQAGYESVALIPIRAGGETIALLQLNDSRPGRLTEDMILLFEGIGVSIGTALQNKQRGKALIESERRYRTLVEHTFDLIAEVSSDGRALYISPNHKEILGYEPEELIGRVVFEHVHPEDVADVMAKFAEGVETLSTVHANFRYRHKNGKWRWLESTGTLYRTYTGELRGVISSRDITERLRAQEELKNSYDKLRMAIKGIINTMVLAIEIRDPYTAGHQQRVADLARAIAKEMGLSKDKIEGIRIAGSIHDIGKISIPMEILSKPGKLTDNELKLLKIHPLTGSKILEPIEFPWPVAKIVLQHHERMDGSGYPHGLSGEDIIIEARILAVADIVEAMSSHRPYRPAWDIEKVLELLLEEKGIVFDAGVVDALVVLIKEKGFKFKK